MSEFGLYRGHPAWMRWIRAAAKDDEERLGFPASALDVCTSLDIRALTAVAACWELYTVADESGEQAALQCVRELLTAMEPSCWIFARALIARSMDWRDRDRVWPMVVGAEQQRVADHPYEYFDAMRPRCEWEDCGRVPTAQRGYFRFCEAHAAEIDAFNARPCVDCAAGNCGRHLKA
jgi:hypothetical protein